ncbi:unnamed protein product [Moneuplotes crassus]|uniref:Uncharacterized protein n=1 Tax=Euplotes crassus TaxID=5936 RepID=A0AAD1U747_EUPCR|nr:unnamed protein product [Moneuplotes crassus]
MFYSNEEGNNLKLIDFGLATSYYKINEEGEGKYIRMMTTVGTVYYMAPEIISGDYSNACDMWAIGVILYLMLAGEPPFDAETEVQILEKIAEKGEVLKEDGFKGDIWKHVSDEAKDLICNLLTAEDNRISPKEALRHPWFNQLKKSPRENKSIEKKYMNKLKRFQNLNSFKKCIFTFMATRAGDEEIQKQIKIFRSLDKNQDGYITCAELRFNMKDLLSSEEINQILEAVDTDKNGAINYNEFITATLGKRTLLNKKRIMKAYKLLDVNHDGVLSTEDLQGLIKKKSLEFVTPQLLEEILEICDYDKDGKVTFAEFERSLTKDTLDM